MFELTKNMKLNVAKVFAEFIKTKYDERTLLDALKSLEDTSSYIYDTIDNIDGAPVECYYVLLNTINSQEREDGYDVHRDIVIIVTADEKAVFADMTSTEKIVSRNGLFDIEDSFITARVISIAEAVELWK